MPTIIVRPVQEQDLLALCDILNEIISIGGSTAYEGVFEAQSFDAVFVSGESCLECLVAVVNGTPMGFQAVAHYPNLPDDWLDISTFARVSGKVKGVGSALFSDMAKLLAGRGFSYLSASIRSDNQQGLAFYSKMGFEDYAVDKAITVEKGLPIDRISKKYRLQS